MQESLDASLVRIRTANGGVVGAGFLVGENQILTCAHVVSQALGLADHSLDAPQGLVWLDFALVSPRTLLTAKVVQWCPLLADERGDIAGLELQGELPVGAEVVRFALAEDLWEHSFRAFGFPAGYDDGVWATGRLLGRQATDWMMIEDIKAQGFAVGPGFSGTPVWDTHLQGVVGMVVTASRPADTKTAFVLPLDLLVAAWPLIEPVTRPRVFLSAAPTDTDFADRLRADLEARGMVVWSEQQTSDDSQIDKEERQRQAIRAAQAVVVVVSSQTRSSRTVKKHLRLADLYQRRLILVWVGDDEHVQPPLSGWRETVWIDAHHTSYETTLEAIQANINQCRSISAFLGPAHAIPEEERKEPRNPYKGLEAFTAKDMGDFFGRDFLVDELVKDVERLLGSDQLAPKSGRLLTIIGPSGSGKSSVVMAGLLPRLQQGALPGSEAWIYLEPMRPGKHPIEELGLTLAAHFPDRNFISLREDLNDDAARGLHVLAMQLVKLRGSRVVLLVDQFEELFTQTADEEERQQFIDVLLTALSEPRGPLIGLLTLRADFYDRPIRYPQLAHCIQDHQHLVLPMEVEDLRAAIRRPAGLHDVQLTFEGNLVGDLLFELRGQIGALPLLQFTLDRLFTRRSGHLLTLSAYRQIGGVQGALTRQAEETYASLLSEEHRQLTQAVFVRLVDPGTSEQDTTRRRAAGAEFVLTDPVLTRRLREVIDAFIAARLLTTNQTAGTTTLEVSHEAVIRAWPRLAVWLQEAREDIHLQREISEDAAEWSRRGEPVDRLYRGSQLEEAIAWSERNWPSRQEEAFLQAGVAEHERQHRAEEERKLQEQQRQTHYTRRVFLAGAAGLGLAVAAVVMVGRIVQQENQVPPYIYKYTGHAAPVSSIAWAPNGSNLASGDTNGTVRVWNAHTGETLFTHEDNHLSLGGIFTEVSSIAWAPNGGNLVSEGRGETVWVWDVHAGKTLFTSTDYTDIVTSVAWASGGGRLAWGSADGTVWVWDYAHTSKTLLAHTDQTGVLSSIAWAPDGSILAAGSDDKIVWVWDVHAGKTLFTSTDITATVTSMAWAPDGSRLAAGSQNIVWVWNVHTGKTLLAYTGHTDTVTSVAWAPDGSILASGSHDKTAQVWHARTGKTFFTYTGHTDTVTSVAWAPDGSILASGSDDSTVQEWLLPQH